MNCLNCGRPLVGRQKKFCCTKCKNTYNNKKYQNYTSQRSRADRRMEILIESLGGKCSICGTTKDLIVEGPGINRRTCANMSIAKLVATAERVICKQCAVKLAE